MALLLNERLRMQLTLTDRNCKLPDRNTFSTDFQNLICVSKPCIYYSQMYNKYRGVYFNLLISVLCKHQVSLKSYLLKIH